MVPSRPASWAVGRAPTPPLCPRHGVTSPPCEKKARVGGGKKGFPLGPSCWRARAKRAPWWHPAAGVGHNGEPCLSIPLVWAMGTPRWDGNAGQTGGHSVMVGHPGRTGALWGGTKGHLSRVGQGRDNRSGMGRHWTGWGNQDGMRGPQMGWRDPDGMGRTWVAWGGPRWDGGTLDGMRGHRWGRGPRTG